MFHGLVDEIDGANDIVRVIEPLDKVREPFRRIRREMKHVIELVFAEESVESHVIDTARLDKRCTVVDVIDEPARKIVERDDIMPAFNERIDDMRTDKSGRAGNEGCRHFRGKDEG